MVSEMFGGHNCIEMEVFIITSYCNSTQCGEGGGAGEQVWINHSPTIRIANPVVADELAIVVLTPRGRPSRWWL